jgi:hypothetical protein
MIANLDGHTEAEWAALLAENARIIAQIKPRMATTFTVINSLTPDRERDAREAQRQAHERAAREDANKRLQDKGAVDGLLAETQRQAGGSDVVDIVTRGFRSDAIGQSKAAFTGRGYVPAKFTNAAAVAKQTAIVAKRIEELEKLPGGQTVAIIELESEQRERQSLPVEHDERDPKETARREWLAGCAEDGLTRNAFLGLRVDSLLGRPEILDGKPLTGLRDGIEQPIPRAKAPAPLSDQQRLDQIHAKWKTGNSTDAEYREEQAINARLGGAQ